MAKCQNCDKMISAKWQIENDVSDKKEITAVVYFVLKRYTTNYEYGVRCNKRCKLAHI